jgi:RNA polymerase sigma-70 factor, ECF subfamily
VVEGIAAVTEPASRAEHVFRKEHARLWRALFAYTGQSEISSDAVAEAFAQLLSRGEGVRDASAWVWKAAFRIASGELKKQARRPATPSADPYSPPETMVDLLAALRRLSPKQRLAVVLHDYADRPTDEVSRILGVTRGTVHVHLSQGRARLRKLLEEDDG